MYRVPCKRPPSLAVIGAACRASRARRGVTAGHDDDDDGGGPRARHTAPVRNACVAMHSAGWQNWLGACLGLDTRYALRATHRRGADNFPAPLGTAYSRTRQRPPKASPAARESTRKPALGLTWNTELRCRAAGRYSVVLPVAIE